MPRSLQRNVLVAGGVVVLLALVVLTAPRLVRLDRYRSRLEAAASAVLGMDVRVGGRLGLRLLPGVRVTLEDARILDAHGVAVATARRTRLWVEPLPLLRGEFRLRRVELFQPRFALERDAGGRWNVEGLEAGAKHFGVLDGASVALSDGTLHYADRRSGEGFEAAGLELNVSRLRLGGGNGPRRWKDLSLRAQLSCREIRTKDFSVSALKATVVGKEGTFELGPVTMRIFGGPATGRLRADLAGPVPAFRVRCALSRFHVEEFLRTLSPKPSAEGAMDFSASLSMQGGTRSQLVRTAAGELSLRGENLTLVGNDLDGALSRFESSQNFNLVDVGAVFFAGPVGLAGTRGISFANVLRGSGGHSDVRILVSDWKVERGVARAQDVAMATSRSRIALQGGLDFVHGRFVDVTVAAVDARGCVRVRQAVHGSFEKPVVEKPRVLASLGGPVLKLVKRLRDLLPAGPCEAFYSGSVAPPK